MMATYDEQSGLTSFDVSEEELNWAADELERDGVPKALKEIALRILRSRLGDSNSILQEAEDLLLEGGERMLSRLAEALRTDPRFTCLEDQWFLAAQLPQIDRAALRKLHYFLLQNSGTPEEEMLSVVNEKGITDQTTWRMALHAALHRLPERFENIGTSAHPRWKARLPDLEQAQVIHYAYDPETYEVLCRPGQRLTAKKAERLQAFQLYAHVVTFAE